MDSVLRKLGLKKGDSKESDARKQLQKELFAFQKGLEYGFPNVPSAIAHDQSLGFLAIGTANGSVKIYGKPGVQFTGQHSDSFPVNQMFFLPEQARLVTLCGNSSLHLWEMNTKDGNSILDEIKTFKMDVSKAKTITSCCVSSDCEEILLGSDGGKVYVLDVSTFDLTNKVITQDALLEKASEELKVSQAVVEVILQHPSSPEKFLIGLNFGLLVLWDMTTSSVEQTYNTSQQLESAAFYKDGEEFVTSHLDGSYTVWKTSDGSKPKENATTPYGPFPCKAISKISIKSSESNQFLIFSGGMPRSSYGDRNTVTVMCGEKHVIFDLTSRVIDFLTLSSASDGESQAKVLSLIILSEQELVSIDLTSNDWPVQRLPYLVSLHASPVTSLCHVNNAPESIWNKLAAVGSSLFTSYSRIEVPLNGGKIDNLEVAERELLITGHEDGSVLFWNVSAPRISLMYRLNTADFFVTDDQPASQTAAVDSEDGWPPFRKVGTYELFADSQALCVQKIDFCAISETLVLAGACGQIIVLNFSSESNELDLKAAPVSTADSSSGWHGPEAPVVKSETVKLLPGFHPYRIVQMKPAAQCNTLALNSELQLIAVGSNFGFFLYDYASDKVVFTKYSHVSLGSKQGVSRSRSFQLTLRESFRHLRKRPSESKDSKPRPDSKLDTTKPEADEKEEGKEEGEDGKAEEVVAAKKEAPVEEDKATPRPDVVGDQTPDITSGEETKVEGGKPDVEDPKVETSQAASETEKIEAPKAEGGSENQPEPSGDVEEKPREHNVTFAPSSPSRHAEDVGDGSNSTPICAIRCLYFAQTFITNTQTPVATLWVGTTGGQILVYQLTIPPAEKRSEEEIQCILAKEIQLRHRASIVAIYIIDRDGNPLPAPLEVQHERAKAPDMTGGHKVLVCSQEQLKVFTLPSLKASNKYKLSVHHNEAKISHAAFSSFRSKSDEVYVEKDLVCLTNQRDVAVFTVPMLRLQLKAKLTKKEDTVLAPTLCVFAQNGVGFYLPNPSELEKFSLSAAVHGRPECSLELKEGMRPVEEKAEEAPVPATETDEGKTEDAATAKVEEQAPELEAKVEVVPDIIKTKEDNEQAAEKVALCGEGDEGPHNDSMAFGDITNDSVKVHFSEGTETTIITCHDVIENKMVVKTTERTISDAQGVRTESKTVVEEMSSCAESSIQEGSPVVTVGGQ